MATIGPVSASTSNASSSIGLQDFLKILLTQLSYQDPLKPMDNQQFMAQMAQFTTLQQTQALNTKLDELLSTQASLQSVGLLGKTIEFNTSSGTVQGTVTALSLSGSAPSLTVRTSDGTTLSDVALSQIASVQ